MMLCFFTTWWVCLLIVAECMLFVCFYQCWCFSVVYLFVYIGCLFGLFGIGFVVLFVYCWVFFDLLLGLYAWPDGCLECGYLFVCLVDCF